MRRAFRQEFGIGDDERLLLFVGSGFIKKGLDRAIAAFAALPIPLRRTSRLFVVGEDNAKPFERRIARLGLTDRITFFSGRDDVPRFLFSADALVLPAYDENTGTVILEAMIAGLPVLVTENCGYAHYVEQANAGLIVHIPYEQQSLDDKLVELLTSPERDRWRHNGIAFGNRPEIYRLVEAAVDRLEAFASRSYRRPAPKPEMAFCLLKYVPHGGMQRDFLRTALRCQEQGFRIRIYALSWEGRIPDGMDVIIVPVHGITNHRRYARYADWVASALEAQPVVCTVGFHAMAGLDVYYAAEGCYAARTPSGRAELAQRAASLLCRRGARSVRPRRAHQNHADRRGSARGVRALLRYESRSDDVAPTGHHARSNGSRQRGRGAGEHARRAGCE